MAGVAFSLCGAAPLSHYRRNLTLWAVLAEIGCGGWASAAALALRQSLKRNDCFAAAATLENTPAATPAI